MLGSGLDQAQAKERGLRKIEAALALRSQESLQPGVLFGGGQIAPILLLKVELHLVLDDLEHLVEPFPGEGSAQDRMAPDHLLPGLLESREIQSAKQAAGELLDVHPQIGRNQAME